MGPEHAHLQHTQRATYVAVTDTDSLAGFDDLSHMEGIVPALETSHAISYTMALASKMRKDQDVLVLVSGRGDKDFLSVAKAKGISLEHIMQTTTH